MNNASCLLAPGPWTRLMARGRHAALDRAIAAGADPAASRVLAARSAQLAGMAMRRRVAADLERVARSSGESGGRFRVRPAAAAVRRNRTELMELASILRADGAAYARGVAMLELVVTDGAGPAYVDGTGARLARWLRRARERLTG